MDIFELLSELTEFDYMLDDAINRGDSAAADKYSDIMLEIDAQIARYEGELPEFELQ